MTLSRRDKLTGLMRKLWLDPKMRAAMAGVSGALGTTGNAAVAGTGALVSVFDAFLVAQLSQAQANRERLAELTDAGMEVLYDVGRFDEKIFEDKDFQGLVFQAAVAAVQETEDEKLMWYAAILAGAASKDRPEAMNLRAILSTVMFLTVDELRLARQFYEGFTLEQLGYSIIDGVGTPSWGPDTDLYLKRLENANLVVSHVVAGLPARFQASAGNYFITDTFRRLMELIQQTEPRAEKKP